MMELKDTFSREILHPSCNLYLSQIQLSQGFIYLFFPQSPLPHLPQICTIDVSSSLSTEEASLLSKSS